MKVEAVKTQVTAAEMFAALREAWQRVFGETPKRRSLLVLVAQWALETGHGKSMRNYNVGNIKSNQKWGDWCFYACWEVINGVPKWFHPDDPACCFRAYKTLSDGAVDYIQTLSGKYRSAWPHAVAGEPEAFVRALKVNRYFTGDVEAYVGTVVSLVKKFDAEFPREPVVDSPTPLQTTTMPQLRRGDSGLPVKVLQTLLNASGGGLKVDGEFGQKTEADVLAFSSSGIVDDAAWARIVELARQ